MPVLININTNQEIKLSNNKGFSNTSAQRYSLALYELSSESNSLDNIEQNSLAILILSTQVQTLIAS